MRLQFDEHRLPNGHRRWHHARRYQYWLRAVLRD